MFRNVFYPNVLGNPCSVFDPLPFTDDRFYVYSPLDPIQHPGVHLNFPGRCVGAKHIPFESEINS